MNQKTLLRALLPALLLAACGGGGDGDAPAPPTGNLSLSGTISAATNIVVDTDTNDPDSVYIANNTPATAQAIGNPVMVGGFVTATPTLGLRDRYTLVADADDIFAVDLVAGQRVHLEIIESPDADIDLGLYSGTGELVDASVGVARFESVTATVAGRYFLRVNAFSGKSNYVLSVGTGATPAASLNLASDFVADEAVVQFRDAGAQAASTIAALGYTMKAGDARRPLLLDLGGPRIAMSAEGGLMADLSGTRVPDALQAKLRTLYRIKSMQKRDDVQSADPNFRVQALRVPNDPYYGYQWHYPMINLPQAWDITTGTPASGNVVVAVVDTGVMLTHADLAANLFRDGSNNVVGYDFIRSASTSNDGDGIDANADDPGDQSTPSSSSWHGTHVAGTMAANSNNGVGVSGVSGGAKTVPVRVIGKGGGT